MAQAILRHGSLPHPLALAPIAMATVLLVPVMAGLVLTGAASLDPDSSGGAALAGLGNVPGVVRASLLSLWIGIASTLLSFATARILLIALLARHSGPGRDRTRWGPVLAPLLGMPQLAFAIGLGFLIAPAGWIARLLSPWATGWQRPPDWPIPGDEWGLSLILALWVKESAFLLFAMLAALPGCDADRRMRLGRSLGHPPWTAAAQAVWPEVALRIRLPLLIVLAYGLSVVDVALILGPDLPPPLQIMAYRRLLDPDPAQRAEGAALALLHLALIGAILSAVLCARGGWFRWRAARRAWRGPAAPILSAWAFGAAKLTTVLLIALGGGALLCLALWAMAGPWRFPQSLPGLASPGRLLELAGGLAEPAESSLLIALAAALLAMGLAVATLECERRRGAPSPLLPAWVIFLPLLVPQLAYLSGIQIGLLRLGLAGTPMAVVLAQLPVVLPYLWLMLAGPWRRLPRRYDLAATALGKGWTRSLLTVRLPLLRPALAASLAIAVAVSIDQYLPTVFAGSGQVATLATEAVTAATGAGRSLAAALGLAQAILPALAFFIALLLAREPQPKVRSL